MFTIQVHLQYRQLASGHHPPKVLSKPVTHLNGGSNNDRETNRRSTHAAILSRCVTAAQCSDANIHPPAPIPRPATSETNAFSANIEACLRPPEGSAVGWESTDDPNNPHNWSNASKARSLSLLMALTFVLTYAAAISAPTEKAIRSEFGCGQVAATATTSLFLIGQGVSC